MKVFISWSGQRSAAVADALRYWLPKVIQALEPWMSADDIEKGTRWRSGLASELEQSSVGIICLTRENLDSTWIHFEAGALSKQQQNTYVCTLIFDLEPTDVREPLAQFQATRATKDDLRKLIFTINNTLGDSKLPESELGESFEVWWAKLEQRLNRIGEVTSEIVTVRPDRELIEEILGIVRTQNRATKTSVSVTRPLLPLFISTADWSPEDRTELEDAYVRMEYELQSMDHMSSMRVHFQSFSDKLHRLMVDEMFARTMLNYLRKIGSGGHLGAFLTLEKELLHENTNP
jgi:hypothetical protein